MRNPREGMKVQLARGVAQRCPEGRENNRTARIVEVVGERCRMDRDLRGCRLWDACDLLEVATPRRNYTAIGIDRR